MRVAAERAPRGAVHPQAASQVRSLDELVHLVSTGAAQPAAVLRQVPGRRTLRVRHASHDWVVKQLAPGMRRDRWHDRRFGGRVRSAAEREYDSLCALRAAGLPVPRPIGWAAGGAAQQLLVMEWVEHRATLRRALESATALQRAAFAHQLVDYVARLHRGGWYHRDLYLQHWLVDPDERLVLIDLGRVRREPNPRRRWFEKDLAALSHSLPTCVPERERLRFFASYARELELATRGEKRRFLRSVERRRSKMARHTPRHGESPPPAAAGGGA